MIELIRSVCHSRVFRILTKLQFVVALTIFTYAALMPASQVKSASCDQCLHFLGNFLLILSACLATFGRYKGWILIAGVIPYSVAMELSQFFTQTRQVDPSDLVANLSGLLVGYLCVLVVESVWHKLNGVAESPG